MSESPETVYHYTKGPDIRLYRVAHGEGRFLHWLEVQSGRPGVVIIPTDGERLLVQRQYRPAVGEWVWQFPRGFGESANVLANAARELQEETGIQEATMRKVGRLLPDPGILSGTVFIVEAGVEQFPTEFGAVGVPGEPDEIIAEYDTLTLDELDLWSASGAFVDGLSLAALQLWRLGGRD